MPRARRASRFAMVLAVASVGTVITACGTNESASVCDSPVTGTVQFISSSVPPPHHLEWTVELGPQSSVLTLTPGYDAPEEWQTTYPTDTDAVAQWCTEVMKLGSVAEIPTGAGVLIAKLAGPNSLSEEVTVSPDAPGPVGGIIPTGSWEEVMAQYEDWQAQYEPQQ